mmetsp:Transcript_60666/g.149177  ORF Transcript_60666/g.149177 Transcript_60666/m.149177 type:complete len:226 (-) Transcript_60666:440-1117(-)
MCAPRRSCVLCAHWAVRTGPGARRALHGAVGVDRVEGVCHDGWRLIVDGGGTVVVILLVGCHPRFLPVTNDWGGVCEGGGLRSVDPLVLEDSVAHVGGGRAKCDFLVQALLCDLLIQLIHLHCLEFQIPRHLKPQRLLLPRPWWRLRGKNLLPLAHTLEEDRDEEGREHDPPQRLVRADLVQEPSALHLRDTVQPYVPLQPLSEPDLHTLNNLEGKVHAVQEGNR